MRRAALIIFDIVLLQAICVAVFVVAMKGFCFQQQRFVPVEEIEQAAIAFTLATYPPSVELSRKTLADGNVAVTYGRPDHPVPISGVDEFRALYPDGCRVLPPGFVDVTPANLPRLLGYTTHTVRIQYLVRFFDNGTLRAVPHERLVTVDRCGKVITL